MGVGTTSFTRYDMRQPLKPGDDSRRNWRRINDIDADVQGQRDPNTKRDAAIAGLRGRPRDVEAEGGGGMNYRGQWTATPTSSYLEFDVVVVATGASAGTYLSVIDNNTNNPSTGIGWVQIAPGDAFGRWA